MSLRQREEFSSKTGSVICLGSFKNKDHKLEQYDSTKLVHTSSSLPNLELTAVQGLSQTRFHKGFNRRNQGNMTNEYTEIDKKQAEMFTKMRNDRSELLNNTRKQVLIAIDAKSGYNIINGQLKGTPTSSYQRIEGIKKISDGLGPEASLRGKSILRESQGRYHAPIGSGANHEFRQEVIYKNGLLKEQGCGILQPGKNDMFSYGIQDQFSKSQYMKTSAVTQTGLIEAHIPGKYTPRKILNHPSGKPEIVEKWNTCIDINNKTSICQL